VCVCVYVCVCVCVCVCVYVCVCVCVCIGTEYGTADAEPLKCGWLRKRLILTFEQSSLQ
jgi:hypothetical protein